MLDLQKDAPVIEPWHCKQIPNGDNPLVVCKKEDLERDVEQWRTRCLIAEGLLVLLYQAGLPPRPD